MVVNKSKSSINIYDPRYKLPFCQPLASFFGNNGEKHECLSKAKSTQVIRERHEEVKVHKVMHMTKQSMTRIRYRDFAKKAWTL